MKRTAVTIETIEKIVVQLGKLNSEFVCRNCQPKTTDLPKNKKVLSADQIETGSTYFFETEKGSFLLIKVL